MRLSPVAQTPNPSLPSGENPFSGARVGEDEWTGILGQVSPATLRDLRLVSKAFCTTLSNDRLWARDIWRESINHHTPITIPLPRCPEDRLDVDLLRHLESYHASLQEMQNTAHTADQLLAKLQPAKRARTVTQLDLSNTTDLDDAKLARILELCPYLDDIDLSGQQNITHLDALAQKTRLKNLRLRDCTGLSNLEGLRNLQVVEGDFLLDGCTALTTDEGLSALTFVGGDFSLDACTALTAIERLSALMYVGGNFSARGCTALTKVEGLSALIFVGGDFSWLSCIALATIGGLRSLTFVGGDFSLDGCITLTKVEGLSTLMFVGGYFSLADCMGMTTLEELSALLFIGGDVHLTACRALARVDGLRALTSVSGVFFLDPHTALTSRSSLIARGFRCA